MSLHNSDSFHGGSEVLEKTAALCSLLFKASGVRDSCIQRPAYKQDSRYAENHSSGHGRASSSLKFYLPRRMVIIVQSPKGEVHSSEDLHMK